LPERKVVNCLSCGKIYDCRNVTNDIIKFLGEWMRSWVGCCKALAHALCFFFLVHATLDS
jgi:hypothetical protein